METHNYCILLDNNLVIWIMTVDSWSLVKDCAPAYLG